MMTSPPDNPRPRADARTEWSRRSFVGAASWLLIAPGVTSARAATRQPGADLRLAAGRPLAVRGGVLLTPLVPRRPAAGWPRRVTLTDGAQTFDGEIIVIEPADPPLTPHWTTDPRDAIIRAIEPDEVFLDAVDAVDQAAGPYLVARPPAEVGAQITCGGATIRPRWIEAPGPPDAGAAPWPVERRPDRPDPFSPFEHWRWALMADAADAAPPTLDRFEPPAAAVASYYADLWRAGLARLAASSRGVADACRRALTTTCRDDDGTELGVWSIDPIATGGLLRTLLDPGDEDAMTRAALAWSDAQTRMEIWTEDESGGQVRLAVANGAATRRVLRFTWAQRPDDIPIAASAPPHAVTRVTIDRPGMALQAETPSEAEQLIAGRTLEPAPDAGDELLIEVDGAIETRRLFRRPWAEARPPRIVFPPPAPPLTLREAAGVGAVIGAAGLTVITLRAAHRRWELFFECLRAPSAPPAPTSTAGVVSRLEDLAGQEGVGLVIGPRGRARVVLVIPEVGDPNVLQGGADSTLAIRRESYADRWYARVTLPASWLDGQSIPVAPDPDAFDAPPPVVVSAFAFVRGHAGLDTIETSPHPTPSWRADDLLANLSRAMVTLESWPALP